MKPATTRARTVVSCALLVVASGCAAAKITDQTAMNPMQAPRPEHVVVYDFVATPADAEHGDAAASQVPAPSEPMTAEEIAAGRALGAAVAERLVDRINDMGLTAARAADWSPRPGDVAIKGHFESIDEGSAAKRIALGFGSGNAEVKTVVEGYLMTEQGLRRVGSATLDSGGGKAPGMLVPIAVTVATANPIGLVVGGAVKAGGELTGRDKIEGAGKRTADAIADELEDRFRTRGWIQ